MEQTHTQPGGNAGENWAGVSVNLIPDVATMKGRPFEPVNWRDASGLERRLSETVNKIPGYNVEAPDVVFKIGIEYFNSRCNKLAADLEKGGADESTINAVMVDYANTVIDGVYNYRATPQQMQTALKAIPPLNAFLIDKYGLFITLLRGYDLILQNIREYQTRVKNEPDAGNRNAYFLEHSKSDVFNDLEAAALFWLLNNGVIIASDFAGVSQETIGAFLNYLYLYGQSGQFVQYVYIARFALHVPREQLEQLNPPPAFDKSEMEPIRAALLYADAFAVYINDYLGNVGKQVEAAILAQNPDEANQARERARKTAGNNIISIPEQYALLSSRQLWAANGAQKDGQKVNDILPISTVIDDYLRRNPQDLPAGLNITPLILQKAIEGVNLLQQIKRVKPVGGYYVFESNLTEFSNLCGYADANEQEKLQLFAALNIISKTFLVLWRNETLIAKHLFFIDDLGLQGKEKGFLRFHVADSGFKGRPNLISQAEYAAMKAKEKGGAKRHFRGQILAKGHKEENALIDEIFSFSDNIREAERTGNAEQIAAANEYKRKNWANSRKKLARWFDDWAKRGIIEYEYKQNKRGQWVYSWNRLQAPTAEELKELRPKIDYLLQRGEQPGEQPDEQ